MLTLPLQNSFEGEINYDILQELLKISQCTPSTTIIKLNLLCTHICKWKNIFVETIPGMGSGEDEGKGWRG
jgi:hypothetical protein